ncbi:MAG: hypothetical protein JOZ69_00120 [Myxococcales bacterium]|nr:hypothetical protein [Myxococcales bacterium]
MDPGFDTSEMAKASGVGWRAAPGRRVALFALAGAAIATSTPARASTTNMMTSFYNSVQKTEHVFAIPTTVHGFRSSSVPLTEFYYDGHWHANLNFNQPSATTPLRGSGMAAMFDGTVQHLFFAQTSSALSASHVDYQEPWELYYTGNWFSGDLTPGGPLLNLETLQNCNSFGEACVSLETSSLSALWDGTVEHVFYASQANHLLEAYNPGGGWFTNDLTAHSGDSPLFVATKIASMWDGATEYVFYTAGGDDAMFKMVSCGPAGCWTQVTDLLAAINDAPNDGMCGFAVGSTLNVFFVSFHDLHVRRVYRTSPGNGEAPFWSLDDVTTLSGETASPLTTPNCYNDGTAWHVFFGDNGGHVQEIYFAGGVWTARDVTLSTGDVNLNIGNGDPSPMTGFSDGSFNHLFYTGVDGHIHEAFHTTALLGSRWAANDLNVSAGAASTINFHD